MKYYNAFITEATYRYSKADADNTASWKEKPKGDWGADPKVKITNTDAVNDIGNNLRNMTSRIANFGKKSVGNMADAATGHNKIDHSDWGQKVSPKSDFDGPLKLKDMDRSAMKQATKSVGNAAKEIAKVPFYHTRGIHRVTQSMKKKYADFTGPLDKSYETPPSTRWNYKDDNETDDEKENTPERDERREREERRVSDKEEKRASEKEERRNRKEREEQERKYKEEIDDYEKTAVDYKDNLNYLYDQMRNTSLSDRTHRFGSYAGPASYMKDREKIQRNIDQLKKSFRARYGDKEYFNLDDIF